jgi:hypothetical protein
MPPGPIHLTGMRRVATLFNNPEYEKVLKYAKKKGLSVYALVKKAVREFIERHP